MAEVRLERSNIERREGVEGGVSWTLRVVFGYRPSAGSLWLSGVYTDDLASEKDAETQLLSLTERQLFVRYNPAKPSEYFLDPYRDVFEHDLNKRNSILKY